MLIMCRRWTQSYCTACCATRHVLPLCILNNLLETGWWRGNTTPCCGSSLILPCLTGQLLIIKVLVCHLFKAAGLHSAFTFLLCLWCQLSSSISLCGDLPPSFAACNVWLKKSWYGKNVSLTNAPKSLLPCKAEVIENHCEGRLEHLCRLSLTDTAAQIRLERLSLMSRFPIAGWLPGCCTA